MISEIKILLKSQLELTFVQERLWKLQNVNDPYLIGTSTAGLETYIMGTHNWIIRYKYLSLHYREGILHCRDFPRPIWVIKHHEHSEGCFGTQ